MDIVILNKSDKPIYEQLYEQITAQILNGILEAEFCLPSIREIAKELGISVITVKKAYELLENDGLIYARAGKGCFVSGYTDKNLQNRKYTLATQQIKKNIGYYKNLNISLDDLVELIKKVY